MLQRLAKPPSARVPDCDSGTDRPTGVFLPAAHSRPAWQSFVLLLFDPFWMSEKRLEEVMDELDGLP